MSKSLWIVKGTVTRGCSRLPKEVLVLFDNKLAAQKYFDACVLSSKLFYSECFKLFYGKETELQNAYPLNPTHCSVVDTGNYWVVNTEYRLMNTVLYLAEESVRNTCTIDAPDTDVPEFDDAVAESLHFTANKAHVMSKL